MTLKTSFQLLRKKFHLLFLLELSFWFSLLFFLIYIKNKLLSYMGIVNTYLPQLNAVGQAAEQNTLDSAQAAGLLTILEAASSEASFFITITVPLVIILLWCVFQSLSWYVIKDKTVKHFKPFFIKFTLISLIILGIAYSIIGVILGKVMKATPLDVALLKILAISFIALYCLTGIYFTLSDASFKQAVKRFFSIFIKRPYKVLLPYILFFIITAATFVLLISELLLQYLNNASSSLIFTVLYFLIFLLVGLLLKVFLQQKVAEIK
jgi:hypothetical protein